MMYGWKLFVAIARAAHVPWPVAALRPDREKEVRSILLCGRVWSEPDGVDAAAQENRRMQPMTERDTLKKLIDDGTVATTLHMGSSARHAISALQTLLHWLGFDRKLKWEKFGADGDYGKATTAAVAEFAGRNANSANGERVSSALAAKILARYDSLEELKQLAEDVEKSRIERHYRKGGTDRVRIATLQTLLNELGFDKELNWNRFGADGDYGRSTTAALAAFGKREGVDGVGEVLTMPLAKRIVAHLSPFYGDSWWNLSHKPTPAPASLSVQSVTGNNNRQYLNVSDGVRQKRFSKFRLGLFTTGGQKPAAFVASHADKLRALKVTQSEINVMIAVAENEGNLDAINTWDNAFLSFGLFQWTAGTGSAKGELPALLARIKDEDRDLFDKYCGQHGLDVAEVTPGPVYGYFSLRGTTIKTPAAKAQLRNAPWAFYFWLAGQDPAVQAMEIKHALGRLDQFYGAKVDDQYRLSDLVTSEYGVGLILDNHVNRPAYVKTCLAMALEQTGLRNPRDWGTEEERKLIDTYLGIRATYGRYPMTDAEKRARVTMKYLTNGTISDRRGSFKRSSSSGSIP
jgi:peptidoglycan hydrolase-like protein with peptidoglycan-binding domain